MPNISSLVLLGKIQIIGHILHFRCPGAFSYKYTHHMDCLMSIVKNHSVTMEECYFSQSLSRLGKIIGPDVGKSLSNWHVPG